MTTTATKAATTFNPSTFNTSTINVLDGLGYEPRNRHKLAHVKTKLYRLATLVAHNEWSKETILVTLLDGVFTTSSYQNVSPDIIWENLLKDEYPYYVGADMKGVTWSGGTTSYATAGEVWDKVLSPFLMYGEQPPKPSQTPKAYNDLMEVRSLFEEFERKMAKGIDRAVEKHGLTEAVSVTAEIARIRKSLHDLSIRMFPPKLLEDSPLTEEEWSAYM